MHGGPYGGRPDGLGFGDPSMRRKLRRLATSNGNSGLTGPVDIPEARPDQPDDTRSRWQRARESLVGTVRGLPKVLRLTWQAGPVLTVTIAVITVLTGLLPTAAAYLTKLLLDAVVEAIQIHAAHRPDQTVLVVPWAGTTVHLTSTAKIVTLAVVQLALSTLTALTTALSTICQQLLQERMSLTIRRQVMEHASELHLAYFEGSTSYDVLRQVQQEAPQRPVSMLNASFGLIRTAITFTSMVALLIAVSPLLAVVALLAPVPAFISQARYGARAFILSFVVSPVRRRMDYLSSLVTTDTYAKEVKLFGLGPFLVQRFALLSQTYYARQRRMIRNRNIASTAWGMLSTVAGAAIYLYIALQAVNGHLSLGDLTLYTAAATSVQVSVAGLFTGVSGMYENNLYLDQLFQFLATEPEIKAPAEPRSLPTPVRGHITFDNVTFTYPGAEHPALQGVSFDLLPGQTVAVVGRNGAGKSTLIKLLCRLYDPSAGRVLLDGVDVREYDPDELRTHISAMFQDYVTYQATVAENIGLGDLPRLEDRPRIVDSAERAGIADRVAEMPLGFDSPLGRWFDQGVNLSGGEWQKVALSRAFMRPATPEAADESGTATPIAGTVSPEAPILVLDEPTSALDAQAEHDLFSRLRRLAESRTTLYISHRFSTVRQADRILLLVDGKLAEEGTHAELMALGGGYAQLFQLQAAAYLDAPSPVSP
jgi:ATP-binding cassette, subfamily B, bacterial